MFYIFFEKKAVFTSKSLHQTVVRVLTEHACKVGDLFCHGAVFCHKLHVRQIIGASKTRVVLAEGRRDMNDARAVRQRNERIGDDIKAFFALFCNGGLGVRIDRLILNTEQVRSRALLQYTHLFSENFGTEFFRNPVARVSLGTVRFMVEFTEHVILFFIDTKRDV